MLRLSPGSPSQRIATLSLRPFVRWRSTQFSHTFTLAPTNHLAKGGCQSSTWFHFCCQCSSPASRAQNVSGELTDSACRRLYSSMLLTRAFARNASFGGNRRFSVWRDLKSELMGLGRFVVG